MVVMGRMPQNRFVWAAMGAIAALAAIALLSPAEAYAVTVSIPREAGSLFGGDSIADSLAKGAADILNSVSIGGLAASFENLLGDSIGVVRSAFGQVSQLFGYTVLIIVYLVQLLKIASRMDGNATMPGVKEVVFLLVFFIIFKHLVDHALDYCTALYNGINELTVRLAGGGSGNISAGNLVTEEAMLAILDGSGQSGFLKTIAAAIIWGSAIILQIMTYFSVLARSLQAYVMAIFAPIPLSFLGMEETRGWGMGYLRNFLAICLAGAVIVIILLLLPSLIEAALRAGQPFPALVAACAVAIMAMRCCGAWSKELFGS